MLSMHDCTALALALVCAACLFAAGLRAGSLPWFGEVWHMRRIKGFAAMRLPQLLAPAQHGVVRVRVLGKPLVVVADPLAMDGVTRGSERRNFSLEAFRHERHFDERIQGCSAAGARPEVVVAVAALYSQGMGGNNGASICDSLYELTTERFASHPPPQGRSDLRDWIARTSFIIANTAIFGRNFPATAAYDDFLAFDEHFFALSRGRRAPAGTAARERLVRLMNRYLDEHLVSATALVRDLHEKLASEKYAVSRDDIARHLMMLLWAGASNLGFATLWQTIFVVNDAESLRRVRAETCPTSSRPSFVFDSQDMSSCPNIVTIADETLRYQASSMSWRMCLKDTLLPCADGSVFHVRKGEMVCGIPYSWHHSAALWAQPHAFAPFDNFPAGRPRGDSYSSVSRSRGNSYSSMSRPRGNSLSSESGALLDGKAALQRFHPWGGGATICPGRRVAITHMRIFLATFFATFDVVDADAVPPGNWATKTGPGIVVPAREWCATLAKRA